MARPRPIYTRTSCFAIGPFRLLNLKIYFTLIQQIGRHHHHRYANWTLKAGCGKYLSVNEQNELILSEEPTVFKVFFIGMNRQFVKLYVTGKGFVKVILLSPTFTWNIKIVCDTQVS